MRRLPEDPVPGTSLDELVTTLGEPGRTSQSLAYKRAVGWSLTVDIEARGSLGEHGRVERYPHGDSEGDT